MRGMTNRSGLPFAGLLAEAMTALLIIALPAKPQQQPPASTTSMELSRAADITSTDPNAPAKDQHEAGATNDRLFFALPNYLTTSSADKLPPLSASEKFKEEARSQFDKFEYPWYGTLAAISQAQNSERQFGQGFAGYGKRFATTLGDGAIENFLVAAALPSMLRQDPRYFQMAKGGFWRRSGYALSRLVITRGDSGRPQPNFSEIAGNATAAVLSMAYHPAQDRTVSNVLDIWGTQLVWDGLSNELKEFWPDMHWWFLRHKHKTE